jgi:hypothetical protein
MLLRWRRNGRILLLVLLVLGPGCSGINTSHSVSPAMFFLPGLGEAEQPAGDDPAIPGADLEAPVTVLVAQTH